MFKSVFHNIAMQLLKNSTRTRDYAANRASKLQWNQTGRYILPLPQKKEQKRILPSGSANGSLRRTKMKLATIPRLTNRKALMDAAVRQVLEYGETAAKTKHWNIDAKSAIFFTKLYSSRK